MTTAPIDAAAQLNQTTMLQVVSRAEVVITPNTWPSIKRGDLIVVHGPRGEERSYVVVSRSSTELRMRPSAGMDRVWFWLLKQWRAVRRLAPL